MGHYHTNSYEIMTPEYPWFLLRGVISRGGSIYHETELSPFCVQRVDLKVGYKLTESEDVRLVFDNYVEDLQAWVSAMGMVTSCTDCNVMNIGGHPLKCYCSGVTIAIIHRPSGVRLILLVKLVVK